MSNENLVFAGDFPTPSYTEWRRAVDKALKGAPFEKRMVTGTYEGIAINPIYSRQDWPAEREPSGFPGEQPFTRGFSASGVGTADGWCVRQEQAVSDLKDANAAILTDLEHGATSLVVHLDRAARAGLDPDKASADWVGTNGVAAYSLADFDILLDKVRLDRTPISLVAGNQFMAAAALLAALWQKRGIRNKAQGAFNADPLGALAESGSLPVTVETAFTYMADLAAYTARTWPNVTAVGVDTTPYYDAGATETQDLACAMATAVTYLRVMTESGLNIDTASHQIAFTFSIGCDFFLSIAKIRAARKLWAHILNSCGVTTSAARIHARTAERMMTRRDPWVNMLRTTTAAFAAGVGGANSVTVLPFDHALGQSNDLSRRIARNSQVILREESALTKVIDPAGGSWYVESLTDQLAYAAWGLFQDIEKAGGIVKGLANGTIVDQIATVWRAREKAIAHRRDPITGVSEFPNIAEIVPTYPVSDREALVKKTRAALPVNRVEATAALKVAKPGSLSDTAITAAAGGATIGSIAEALGSGGGTMVRALPRHSLAGSFEVLRDTADAYKIKTGAWPSIFLANLGPIAAHTARATYAKNFFEAGGIQALTNNGFTDAEPCTAAFQDSGARIAILCSSDALYESHVAKIAPALKAAKCMFLFLAGNPGHKRQTYIEVGVDDFIFVGCDVLGTLRAILTRLGVTH